VEWLFWKWSALKQTLKRLVWQGSKCSFKSSSSRNPTKRMETASSTDEALGFPTLWSYSVEEEPQIVAPRGSFVSPVVFTPRPLRVLHLCVVLLLLLSLASNTAARCSSRL